MGDELLTVNEVASILKEGHWTTRRRIDRGDLGTVTRLGRKGIRVNRAALEAFIKAKEQGAENGR